MAKIFGQHMHCIRDVLKDISWHYKEKKNFLDLGCGDGRRTAIFDDFGRNICGVDYQNWLDGGIMTRINFKQCDFVRNRLPYRKESFDIILSFDVIEHLSNPEVLLNLVYDLLKTDGIFVISTPNRNRLFGFFLCLLGLRKFPYGTRKQEDPYALHVIEYRTMELVRLLNSEGFRVIKCHKVFYGITGWYGIAHFFSLPLFHNIILECQKGK